MRVKLTKNVTSFSPPLCLSHTQTCKYRQLDNVFQDFLIHSFFSIIKLDCACKHKSKRQQRLPSFAAECNDLMKDLEFFVVILYPFSLSHTHTHTHTQTHTTCSLALPTLSQKTSKMFQSYFFACRDCNECKYLLSERQFISLLLLLLANATACINQQEQSVRL